MNLFIKKKKLRLIAASCVFMGCVIPVAFSQEQAIIDTPAQKIGYSIGVNIGINLAQQGLLDSLDMDALLAGLRDGTTGELLMTEDEIMMALQEFGEAQQAKIEAAEAAAAEAGQAFLSANSVNSGVVTTASGLQYEVISRSEDNDSLMPTESDTVRVHYHGTLADGTVFDSSVERGEPISFPLNGVISGWTEGLQLMHVGDKFRFTIPPELGYGSAAVGPIPPNSVLIFEVELLGIE